MTAVAAQRLDDEIRIVLREATRVVLDDGRIDEAHARWVAARARACLVRLATPADAAPETRGDQG